MSKLSKDWIERLGEPYLPGAGREPPRGIFDDIKRTIPVRVDAEALSASPALDLARDLYGARYFWEAHEVLDAVWRATLPNTRQNHFLHAFIELTNACQKLRMRQPNAAARHVRETEKHMAAARGLEVDFDCDGFLLRCAALQTEILTGDIGAALAVRPSLEPQQTALDA
jgi:hypothetical protein